MNYKEMSVRDMIRLSLFVIFFSIDLVLIFFFVFETTQFFTETTPDSLAFTTLSYSQAITFVIVSTLLFSGLSISLCISYMKKRSVWFYVTILGISLLILIFFMINNRITYDT